MASFNILPLSAVASSVSVSIAAASSPKSGIVLVRSIFTDGYLFSSVPTNLFPDTTMSLIVLKSLASKITSSAVSSVLLLNTIFPCDLYDIEAPDAADVPK